MAVAGDGGVTIDAEVFLRAITALQPPKLDTAVKLALVDTAKSTISKAGSLIAKRTGLKTMTVRKLIRYDEVRQGDRQVIIRSSRKPIPIIEFPSARQTKAGVRVNVWGQPQVLQRAFIATMPSTGYRGVFRRVGKKRTPIKQMWGPTIQGTFVTEQVLTQVRPFSKDVLRKALVRRIKYQELRSR